MRLHADDVGHSSLLRHLQAVTIQRSSRDAPPSSSAHGHSIDLELLGRANEPLVDALAPLPRPAMVALVASRTPRRNGALHADIDELVQLGRPLSLELGQPRAVDSAMAFGRDEVKEAAVNALAFLLAEGLLRGGQLALLHSPLVEEGGVLQLLGLVGGGDVELVQARRVLERAALRIAVALAVAALEERPVDLETAANGSLLRHPVEVGGALELRLASVGTQVQVGHARHCDLEVGDDLVIEQLLDHGVVVLHVRGDDEMRLGDDVRQLQLVKHADELRLLSLSDVGQILDTQHEHHRDNSRLHLVRLRARVS